MAGIFRRFLRIRYGTLLLFLLLIPYLHAEENVQSFDNNWSIMGLLNYRYLQYQQSDLQCRTNAPYELGLGVSYRQFSLSFGIRLPFLYDQNIPVSDSSFDAGFKYFGKIFSFNAFIAAYPSFFLENPPEGTDADVGLALMLAGMTMRWTLASDLFSFRSVYRLNQMQVDSAGSLWIGCDHYLFAVQSTDEYFQEYAERRTFLYTGPSIGYSYTWTFRHGLFLNVDFGGSLDMGIDIHERKMANAMPVLMSGITFGAHFKTWSFNLSVSANYFFLLGSAAENRLLQLNGTPIRVVKRF